MFIEIFAYICCILILVLTYRNVEVTNYVRRLNHDVFDLSVKTLIYDNDFTTRFYDELDKTKHIKMRLMFWKPCWTFFEGTLLEKIAKKI